MEQVFNKGSSKEAGYFKIWDWDGENFQIDTYFLDDGVWESDSETLRFLAGNDLKFLFLLQNETEGFAFVALVDGKQKTTFWAVLRLRPMADLLLTKMMTTMISESAQFL